MKSGKIFGVAILLVAGMAPVDATVPAGSEGVAGGPSVELCEAEVDAAHAALGQYPGDVPRAVAGMWAGRVYLACYEPAPSPNGEDDPPVPSACETVRPYQPQEMHFKCPGAPSDDPCENVQFQAGSCEKPEPCDSPEECDPCSNSQVHCSDPCDMPGSTCCAPSGGGTSGCGDPGCEPDTGIGGAQSQSTDPGECTPDCDSLQISSQGCSEPCGENCHMPCELPNLTSPLSILDHPCGLPIEEEDPKPEKICSGGTSTVIGWRDYLIINGVMYTLPPSPASSYYTLYEYEGGLLASGHTRSAHDDFNLWIKKDNTQAATWFFESIPMSGWHGTMMVRCLGAVVTSVSLNAIGEPFGIPVQRGVLSVMSDGTTCVIPC